jgi:chromosomal replication initiation ATPase DnaA
VNTDNVNYFVDAAVGREVDNPAKDVYGGMILGKIRFIKDTLRRIKEEYHVKDAISNRKALRAAYGIEEVIEGISSHFNVLKSDVMAKKASGPRNIAVYLIKERTGATNRQIGEYFNGLTCSAVAKIYSKITEGMREDRKLRGIVYEVEKALDTFKP